MTRQNPEPAFIPLVDLKAQTATIRDRVDAAISGCLDRCDFILGEAVEKFETEFAQFSGARQAIGCANGTDAIHLSLRALGIGPGDEVIIPAMTFIATALGVSLTGAAPVLVDVRDDNALIDPALIEAAITEKTRAIMPVHLFGQCADMTAIQRIADAHGLLVIEDAAQAHGAHDASGRRAGSIGDVGCFSFYPGKNLGAYGDGGIITTKNDEIGDRIRFLRNWGSRKKYHHEEVGLNSRLDTLQAAILSIKLEHLEDWNAARRRHAAAYDEALAALGAVDLTAYDPGTVYHLYVIRSNDRDAMLGALNDAGIGAGIHYPFAVHELKAYKELGYQGGEFPIAEDWARRCISLPIYAELPADAAARAAAVIERFAAVPAAAEGM